MWRLERHLVGQCVYLEQEISFIGVIAAKVQNIFIDGMEVSAAHVTSSTKLIYRSLSAKATIFIQVCRELWEFAGDGERYNEKIVHSFLPALFGKWREAGTTHIVTIVLISRVFYDSSEIAYAAGPLRCDDEDRWYKDFFKVITDLEVLYDWKPTLVSLKDSFWAFQHDILLAHHHHRATLSSSPQAQPDRVRLVGQLSYAHDGPILEALNLGLNPGETHYVDRSLSLTGAATIVITPGTGYFRVSKQLLRLTTTRLLDQGFALDLVSLAKAPLHQSPVFAFQGSEPQARTDSGKLGSRALDPLWGGDDESSDSAVRRKTTFWWEPFWMSISFWDKQMDLPFRKDRFIARAKMHEIEMLGLLDYDVLSSIEIPFLPEPGNDTSMLDSQPSVISQEDADKFDMDIFAAPEEPKPAPTARTSIVSISGMSALHASLRSSEIRRSTSSRVSELFKIHPPIEEDPQPSNSEQATERLTSDAEKRLSSQILDTLSTSPSQSSIHSMRSARSQKSVNSVTSSNATETSARKKSKFTSSWLFSPFRSAVSQPQMSAVSASGIASSPAKPSPIASQPGDTAPTATHSSQSYSLGPSPMNISSVPPGRPIRGRNTDEETIVSHRSSLSKHSPVGTPPRDEGSFGKRRSGALSSSVTLPLISSPAFRTNPSRPQAFVPYTQSSLARRWQHIFPRPLSKHEIKWKSMVTPGCLPLTVEYFPTTSELEGAYDVFSYDFVVDPLEMRSFLVKPPAVSGYPDDVRRAWALEVMRGMVAVRLAQGFQFVLQPSKSDEAESDGLNTLRRSKSYIAEEELLPKPAGAAEVLRTVDNPVYLSMSNEIHRISYSGDSIQLRRYVRRMPRSHPFEYQCLIWPKLGVGYTELKTSFVSHGLENYGWNRLDMLVAGYETQFNDSLRYWRTRFVVIPTDESPSINTGPSGEKLNDEEVRLLGMDKLAELFSKVRWQPPEDRGKPVPPVRIIPTDLGPAACVLDESLTARLDDIHATGPLRKKMKSERDIADMSLALVVKAMREEDGVPIKDYRWHSKKYPNSFTGSDFVSWLVREFRDVSTREQATEYGVKLHEQGLFEHCRRTHGFLDGHYFYTLRGEYIAPVTPRSGWFRTSRHVSTDELSTRTSFYPGSGKAVIGAGKKTKKRLILSQSMVIDVDPNKRSDQAESVLLHHDIIHNPATCFHFELQWIGTTARCIDDLLHQWSRTIERYGLKLVEAYVTQISDIRENNPFQSCFPIPLKVSPPIVPDLERRVPEGTQTRHYFEYALLKKFGFVLDIEAADLYPEQIEVVYSYRRSPYKHSQWVHKSGVAFVQVVGGNQGFLFLTNRLMAPGRLGTSLKYQRPAAAAEKIRAELKEFCANARLLVKFYDEELANLEPVLEEPDPLRI
ncbi:hypothetical protein OBBRIDRAFT_464550 [Obba rivulosa]|uniref:Vacuolar membrane-associated protein IML1 n=1 Tax=Obba rivulosa TaxID=1052685 RepID=A0A8E2B1R4_9APHY|nr:hypothetical protein OBBRIDRAFT_464550 [Obba rivulosa]